MSAQKVFKLATEKPIVIRSLKVALVVGTILVLINHFDKLLALQLSTTDFFKIGLTYCVPYCVATFGAVTAILERKN